MFRVLFSQNASYKNFERAVLSKIVQRSNKKAFGVETNSHSQGAMAISCAPGVYKILEKRGHEYNQAILWIG